MNRRAFLAVSGLAVSGGCMNSGSTQTESVEETSDTATESPTTSSSKSTEDTATTEASTTATEESTTTTSGPSPSPPEELCDDGTQFESLSQDAQEEFRTALEEDELIQQEEKFQLPEELPTVNDERGQEVCIRYDGEWYYGLYGPYGNEGDYQLTIHSASGEDTETETPSGTETTGEETTGEDE